MARPPGLSNAEWKANVERREAVITDRPHSAPKPRGESQQSVASPANYSPPLWGYAASRDYADGDAHGGSNSNITFPLGTPPRASPSGFNHNPRIPSPAFAAGLSTQYNYSPTPTLTLSPNTEAVPVTTPTATSSPSTEAVPKPPLSPSTEAVPTPTPPSASPAAEEPGI
nr:mucin-1-like [Aegilops tauschii subsp. strangulata]